MPNKSSARQAGYSGRYHSISHVLRAKSRQTSGKGDQPFVGRGATQPSEIAILSVRGRSAKENICHIGELGGHKVVLATDSEADSQIVCDTFLRFKGLERPAVIVTDLRLVSNLYEMRMHMAVSRAMSLLRIVGAEQEMRKDQRLAELI